MSSFNRDNMSISTTEYSSAVSKQRKLTRFDTESALGMDKKSGSGILKQTEGTYPFYSPEMCDKNNTFSGYASDIWAAGICLYIFASHFRFVFFTFAPPMLVLATPARPPNRIESISSASPLKSILSKDGFRRWSESKMALKILKILKNSQILQNWQKFLQILKKF